MIRQATQWDIPAVAEIYSQLHTQEELGRTTIGWIRGVYPTGETARQAQCRGELYVQEDGMIVGAAIFNQCQGDAYQKAQWRHDVAEQDVMVMHTLVISPRVSGRGYGKAFVRFYEEYARAHNCHYLRMDTNSRNTRARSLYRKMGFTEAGVVPCVFNGIEGVNLVLLEKAL